ncbi:MAG: hypothetical protein R3F60_14615 [bacterium]
MQRAHMRPRVELIVLAPPAEVLGRVRATLARGGPVRGQMGGSHLALNFEEAQRHFWSPWLDAHVREHPDGAIIYGRLMPHPSIWTFYMGMYAALTMGALIAGIFGLLQVATGTGWWGLLVPPAALLTGLGLYASAFMGQRLGADQMDQLRQYLDAAVTLDDAPRDH